MTKLADCGGRHVVHRYAQNALSDVFRFSLAKTHTRLQQPASRSASGRVLSPPYAAVRPHARFTGARGQRASRPASGAHPTRGRPVCCRHALVRARPVHQPARAANQIVFMLCCTTLNNPEPAPESVARESLQPNESRNSAF